MPFLFYAYLEASMNLQRMPCLKNATAPASRWLIRTSVPALWLAVLTTGTSCAKKEPGPAPMFLIHPAVRYRSQVEGLRRWHHRYQLSWSVPLASTHHTNCQIPAFRFPGTTTRPCRCWAFSSLMLQRAIRHPAPSCTSAAVRTSAKGRSRLYPWTRTCRPIPFG